MTTIEWTRMPGYKGKTWNPLRGCSHVSAGCTNCYAATMGHRFSGKNQPYEGLTRMTPQGARWTGAIKLVPKMLDLPLRWREPRMVFVNSMSDLFHEAVPDEFIDSVFATMALSPRHIYQVLTKRPERMVRWFNRPVEQVNSPLIDWWKRPGSWPLPNVWLGVSVEDQQTAEERIPWLLQVPAAVRFLSMEPLLGAVDLGNEWLGNERRVDCGGCKASPVRGEPYCPGHIVGGVDWIIVGGESGPMARPMHPDWVRSIRDQAMAAGIPYFFKQWGEWLPGQNDPHPLQTWGLAHWQDGGWGVRELPRNPEKNYVVWYADGEVRYGDQSKYPQMRPLRESVAWAQRVGKKRSGALLDGREWREWPEVAKGVSAS